MGERTEPADSGGVIAVPPELQQAFDEAIAATSRATTPGTTTPELARDAFVAGWQAIARHEAFSSAPQVFRAYVFNMVGLALHLRSGPSDVDAAIAAFEAAVATVPTDSASRPAYLGSLGYALVDRLSHTATTADRDAAIAAFEGALAGTPVNSPKRPGYLTNLGVGLHRRFDSDGVSADLDAAIRAFEEVLELTPVGSTDRPRYLVNLGAGLQARFDAGGASTDLDAIIAAYQELVDATPADDPNRSARLSRLGLGLRGRYDRGRASTDLDTSIATFGEAVAITPADAAERPDRLDSLGSALLERYGQRGAPADLDGAILAFEKAVEISQADDPGRSGRLENLGHGLQDRYTRTGAPADLEAAITAREEALRASSSDQRDRAISLTNLGSGLLDRHFLTGSQADLDAAIAALEEAVEIGTDDPAGQAIPMNNLGGGLSARYSRTGSMADLEAVIAIYEEIVEATPADDPGRPLRLNNLGTCLRERYARKGAIEDLEAAYALFQEALGTIPRGSPERPRIQANIGESLRDRYDAKAELADLEASISAFQQALAAMPPEAPMRPRYLQDMGGGLLARYRCSRVPADLEAAITTLRESIAATPADSPFRVERLPNLALALIERHSRTNDVADLEAAVAAMREACRSGLSVAPSIVLGTAEAWGGWASARGAWAEAAEAYGHGLAAIDRLYESQLLPGAKQTWLGAAQGLAVAAAYALARIGAPAAALLALERGRARVLTEAIQRDRADLSDVEPLDPGAYAAYAQAAEKLRALESQERATGAGRPEATSPTPRGVLQDLARQARRDLQAAIGRLQQLPGHAGFGQLPRVEELAAAAEPGQPLVALLTNVAGSLALVVSRVDDSATPTFEAIWAPELTSAMLDDLLTTVEDGKVVGGYLAGQLGQPAWLESALADGLPKVGTSLIAPVAARLRELNATGVVLLPTGLLGLLPLHAAPYAVDGETHCLLDEFDVSHTPGTRVLGAARAAVAAREAQPPVLVGVGNPQPHPEPLAFARAELEEVVRFFPEGASHPLYETAATETALVGLLPRATHVHLACHGSFDADTPLDSALELARPEASDAGGDDGRLRLEEILANDWFGHTRLVVLSACQTAIIDARRLPDEAIGLPAGLLQAGVPAVIGTLWSVDDLSTTLLMTRFYACHREGDPATGVGPLSPAAALRRAQVWLRTVTADELVALLAAGRSPAAADRRRGFALADPTSRPYADPYYWAPFVAIGA